MNQLSRGAAGVLLLVFACGDDDEGVAPDAAGPDAAPPPDAAALDAAPPPDATPPDGGPDSEIARGAYLANHVALCSACHTPEDEETGAPDPERLLQGNPEFVTTPEGDVIRAPNLTPHDPTGIGGLTDEELKDAFLHGTEPKDEDDPALLPVMPYFVLHNMREEDADAIVAYLRSLDPVENEIAESDIPGGESPAGDVPEAELPEHGLAQGDEDYELAEKGKYLAANVGICMECHTERVTEAGNESPLDLEGLFGGGEVFPGVDVPGQGTREVASENITPHDPTGIAAWSAEDVRTALKEGTDIEDLGVCPPMPSGPMGPYAGLTDEDALAIGTYLVNLEEAAWVENEIDPGCQVEDTSQSRAAGALGH